MARKRKQSEPKTQNQEINLASKYRPKKLEDFVANPVFKKQIASALNQQISQAILLTGPHGTGKTSLARLFAAHLECSEFDLKEIDVADYSGVDTIREIRRNMNSRPMKGNVKVWVLDEVSRLSSSAGQEALLKALEEPPKHCYFFLCTTDPQRILKTLKDRCVQYQTSTVSEKMIFNLTQRVAETENIELPKKAGLQIAKDSLGHPRTALKILESIMFLDSDEMLEAAEKEAENREETIKLCRALMNKSSWKNIAGILKGLQDDPEYVRRAVRGYYKTVLLNGTEAGFIVLDTLSTPYYSIDGEAQLVRDIYECWSELNDN